MHDRDPPPQLSPTEIPTPAELAKLARWLLCEEAQHDARLADEMRRRGIDPEQSRDD